MEIKHAGKYNPSLKIDNQNSKPSQNYDRNEIWYGTNAQIIILLKVLIFQKTIFNLVENTSF